MKNIQIGVFDEISETEPDLDEVLIDDDAPNTDDESAEVVIETEKGMTGSLMQQWLQAMGVIKILSPQEEKALFIKLSESNQAAKKASLTLRHYRKKIQRLGRKLAKEKKGIRRQESFGKMIHRLSLLKLIMERVKISREKEVFEIKKTLVERNLRLVMSIAKKFQDRGCDYLDLIQDGNIGLMVAIEKFDYQRGNRLATYARNWIRHYIMKGVNKNSNIIQIPQHVIDLKRRIGKSFIDLTRTGEHEPTSKQVADGAGLSVQKVEEVLHYGKSVSSIQDQFSTIEELTLEDAIADESIQGPADGIVQTDFAEKIQNLVNRLGDRDAKVIKLLYGLDPNYPKMTSAEVGLAMNLTRSHVEQLEFRSLRQLRALISNKKNDENKTRSRRNNSLEC